MQDDDVGCAIAAIALLVPLMFIGGCLMGVDMTSSEYRQKAIDRGYAEHDAKTGEWRWKEPPPASILENVKGNDE